VFFELTDLLTCPRCGPAQGLVLLVQEVDDRRVRRGWLGCPKCRNDYRVIDGVADLRTEPDAAVDRPPAVADDELAMKIVALSGLAGEPGYLLLGERLAHSAPAVLGIAPELEVIVLMSASESCAGIRGISPVLVDVEFPFGEYQFRCVAIAPGGDPARVAAAARRVAPGGRLLLFDAAAGDLEEAERGGLMIVAAEAGTAVAERKAGAPLTRDPAAS
jgi:uncharacterized protein YbaR (Trm112 family)